MERFEIKVKFDPDEFDGNGRLKADRIFYYFQEASEGDVNARGLGPADLIKNDQIWVMTKMRIRIDGELKPNVEYVCGTFPVQRKSVTFKRDYYIKETGDASGSFDTSDILVRGAAQWCVLDYYTRKPVRTDFQFEYATEEEEMIPGRFPKIHPQDPQFIMEHTVTVEDIDYNDHTNNSRYIALAEKGTGSNVIKDLYVSFIDETRLGDEIKLYCEEQEGGTYVEGRKASGEQIYQILFR